MSVSAAATVSAPALSQLALHQQSPTCYGTGFLGALQGVLQPSDASAIVLLDCLSVCKPVLPWQSPEINCSGFNSSG